MKRLFLFLSVLASFSMAAAAQAYGDGRTIDVDSVWGNPRVNEVNRAPMHVTMDIGNLPVVSLHGTWKFNWVENAWDRPEDYYRTDYDDKGWGTIPVPGMWELNGYGEPVYVFRLGDIQHHPLCQRSVRGLQRGQQAGGGV